MRVITTANAEGLARYGQRWLDGRKHWPRGTEFWWYTEGYDLPRQPDEAEAIERAGLGDSDRWIERRDFGAIADFVGWKHRHAGYLAPLWKFDVVAYAHKVFAFADATGGYDGVAVWLDADCVTYRDIPEGLVEEQVKDAYIAHYARPGRWTETGMFIVDCGNPVHAEFWAWMRNVYLQDLFKPLHHWTDCFVLDAAIKRLGVTTTNLSGDKERHGHPMAVTEFGKYIDHQKGLRKDEPRSPENKFRAEYEQAVA